MSVNKAILVGNLGRDPEVRHTPSGAAVANFTLATNERWKDRDGQLQERTEWHRIVAWDRLAELSADYLSKGRQVYVEGRIQTREWEDREGNKRYTTEIRATNIQLLGRRSDADQPASEPQGSQASAPPEPPPGQRDDDIPF